MPNSETISFSGLYKLLGEKLAGGPYESLVVAPKAGLLSFSAGGELRLFEKLGKEPWQPVEGKDVSNQIEVLAKTGVRIK